MTGPSGGGTAAGIWTRSAVPASPWRGERLPGHGRQPSGAQVVLRLPLPLLRTNRPARALTWSGYGNPTVPVTATAPSPQGPRSLPRSPSRASATEVVLRLPITDAHKPDRPKPRLTVRGLLKRRLVETEVISCWCERGPTQAQAAAVPEKRQRREAAFQPGVAQAQVHPVQAVDPDPRGADRRSAWAGRVHRSPAACPACHRREPGADDRPARPAQHPGIARLPYRGDFADGLLAASTRSSRPAPPRTR